MNDTTPEALALQAAIYPKMPPSRRIQQAVARSASLRQMVWLRVKEAHPGATEAALRRAFADRWLDPAQASQVYGRIA
jgi:hypothetical protein